VPTRWFLLIAVLATLVAGIVAARAPRSVDGPPNTNRPTPDPVVSTRTPPRFRFVDLTGQTAPDFALLDLEGRRHTLSAHRGGVVMLVFWATWCKTCPIEMPHLGAIARALAPGDLVTLSINWEKDEAAVRRMARDTRLGVPVLRDPDQRTRYAYDAFTVPRVVIVDRAGRIARIIRGYDGEAGPLIEALAAQGLALPPGTPLGRSVPVERVPLSPGR
jgi:thiol-disulfide isomerase/thioredoxin